MWSVTKVVSDIIEDILFNGKNFWYNLQISRDFKTLHKEVHFGVPQGFFCHTP